MTIDTDMKHRIEEFVRELEEEFGELPESDEPLITQIEDWAIAIGVSVHGFSEFSEPSRVELPWNPVF